MVLRPAMMIDTRIGAKPQKLENEKNKWHCEAIFVNIFSIKGCMFNFTALFSEEAEMREKRLKMKADLGNVRNLRGKFQEMV